MFAQIFDVVDFEPVSFKVLYGHSKMIEFPTGENVFHKSLMLCTFRLKDFLSFFIRLVIA